MPDATTDTNPAYWAEYSNLQRVKHALIRRYLGGWFAKLGSWAGDVVYFDTHAGRGRHSTGEFGSPLVALQTPLAHRSRDRLLGRCQFHFVLIERDEENLEALNREIRALGNIPQGIQIRPFVGDSYAHLTELLADLRAQRARLAPAFVFVDPYGFKVPCALLRDLMRAGRVELFVNVIWRELDMAIAQGDKPGMAATLDLVFDGPDWRSRITSANFDTRADQAVDLLAEKISARWPTFVRMLGDNNATRYLLVHFTNHDAGRDLMKECMWAECPDGGFFVRKSDDPAQQLLISREPNLAPLRDWTVRELSQGPKRWSKLTEALRQENWRSPHLRTVLGELKREGVIVAEDYTGRFGPGGNPLLRLA